MSLRDILSPNFG